MSFESPTGTVKPASDRVVERKEARRAWCA